MSEMDEKQAVEQYIASQNWRDDQHATDFREAYWGHRAAAVKLALTTAEAKADNRGAPRAVNPLSDINDPEELLKMAFG